MPSSSAAGPPDPYLHELTRLATVHLLAARGGPMWGSGFFVAPGWVLTCAHVLRARLAGDREQVFHVDSDSLGGEPLRARLAAWLVDDDLSGDDIPVEQDLALVKLLDEDVEHECVWLSDCAEPPGVGAHVHGFRPDNGPQRWHTGIDIRTHDGSYGLRFTDTEFPKGVSGGPVLDPHTGAVVAVMKSRRVERDGGRAIALPVLRRFGELYQTVIAEHDQWHGSAPRANGYNWIERQQELPAAGLHRTAEHWSPLDRRAALRLLASVPSPGGVPPVAKLARKARGGIAPPGSLPQPVSWRDGHGLLYEAHRPMPAIAFLHYLKLVVEYERGRGGDPAGLDAWVSERLRGVPAVMHTLVTEARLPEALLPVLGPGAPEEHMTVLPYPRTDGGAVVTVELEPLSDAPDRFYWRIRVHDGDREGSRPVAEECHGNGVAPGQLISKLRRELVTAFESVDTDDCPAPLEVALPADHFDTAVHRWLLTETGRLYRPPHLGVQRRVVLRDLDRRGGVDPYWRERWDGLMAAEALLAVPQPLAGKAPRAHHFTGMAPGEVPVLCRPAGRGVGGAAMRMALDAGHGLALWHTDGHSEHGCREFCTALRAGFAELLGQAKDPTELPDRLRRIREDVSDSKDAQHWAEGVAMLYDDPDRPLPDLPRVDAP
ncbi:trypsin-like peptidase domain-containing protein [Streptomyces sp. NPDC059070]|uniref:VMAP-C domain-containing protein n=1 Tax=Streptomyces sp. NPDC059070 TaxID=3346713 RepID=UPI00367E9E95